MSATIVIIEDELDLLRTLDYSLQREGYRTRPATNGQEAIAAIDQDPVPDLVLLDLMLPDTSGTEICRRIKGAERTKNVPVIMVTAKGGGDRPSGRL